MASTQQIQSSHLSLSQRCRPPYLSPSFQGQAKLFLLAIQHEGWAPLITMTMLAIYLPASWRLECPPPSPPPDPSLSQAVPLPAAFSIGDGLGFQPSSGCTLTLRQWQDGGDGEHRHRRTVQGLWCLLATSDGTSGPEGLHPRVLIFPQGGFTWSKALRSLSEDNRFWQIQFNAFLQHWWDWAGLCSLLWEEKLPLLLGSSSGLA